MLDFKKLSQHCARWWPVLLFVATYAVTTILCHQFSVPHMKRTNIWVVQNKIIPLPCSASDCYTKSLQLCQPTTTTWQHIIHVLNNKLFWKSTISVGHNYHWLLFEEWPWDKHIWANQYRNLFNAYDYIQILPPSVVVISRQISHSYSVGYAWWCTVITYQHCRCAWSYTIIT